jgi:four helix bundle protein
MAKTFKDVIVWQKAHQLVLKVYEYTKSFPSEEKYGLTDDMRRAARSVPTNFAEGFGRQGYKDAMNFFNRSEASLKELEYHTLLSYDLKYLDKGKFDELTILEDEAGRLLTKWQQTYCPKKALQH